MKTYVTNSGETIEAANNRDLVRKLRASSWDEQRLTIKAFIKAMARRARLQTGTRVATNTPTNFVAGLVRAGLLTEQEGGQNV